jgi:Ion channel
VLASIVLTILATAAAGGTDWGRLLYVALMGATSLLTLRTAGGHARVRLVAAVVVAAAILATGASVLFAEEEPSQWVGPTIAALLAVVAPVSIIRRLVRHEAVTFQTVLGALCLYLLAGLFFAFLYGAIDGASERPFLMGDTFGGTIDFVYFSYVTLATVGFGDVTAATDLGRMLAVTEALIGQLYLVSVVAVLVSNLGRTRGARRD